MAQLVKFRALVNLRTPFLKPWVNNYGIERNIHATLCRLERKYSEKHEWIDVSDGLGIVGISSYAQDSLGDIVYAQLPDVGTEVSQDDECGALESVKAASEIFSPVSGVIKETNKSLEDKPALINQSCYDKGWLFKIKLSSPEELNELMNEEKYNAFLKEQDVE